MSLAWKLDNAWHVLLGVWRLRKCTRVGRLPRVYGRPHITNLGTMTIGDKFRFFSTTVTSELVTHPGGRLEIGSGVFLNYGASLSAHKLVQLGDGCQLGSYACLMDTTTTASRTATNRATRGRSSSARTSGSACA